MSETPSAEKDTLTETTWPLIKAAPGTLAYAQMVADRYGDLEDAAIEDGMDDVPAADYGGLVRGLVDLMENHWINLGNSTDRHLATNYGLVVTVDDLRDLLAETRVLPPAV